MKTYYSHDLNIGKVLADVRRRTFKRGIADSAFLKVQEKLGRKNGSKRTQKRRRAAA